MKLNKLKLNENNPRTISEGKFEKLKASIKGFEKMMELRPIVIDEDGVVLGGNMRTRALQALGYDEVPDAWVKVAKGLTEEEKKRFVIEDNVPFGEWDWDALFNEWDTEQLQEWGLDLPVWDTAEDTSREVDTSDFTTDVEIKFTLKAEEFEFVNRTLQATDANKETALLKLLGYEHS